MTDIATVGPLLGTLIKAYGESSDRSLQSEAGIIGPSDLGFCRQKAVLMTRGVPQSDSVSIAAAQIGTAIHSYVAEALKSMGNREWIVDDRKVTATFPSGARVTGTPDVVMPDYNAIIDVKTKDGFEWERRSGISQAHRYQTHTYALGAIQEGILTTDKPLYIGILYIDRSGKEQDPMFIWEEYDPSIIDEIDSWITDVTYAVKHNEDASRDIPSPVCEKICSHFTACRGGLTMNEGGEFIEDPMLVSAVDMYVEGRDMEQKGSKMKKEASTVLYGVNGTTGTYQIRWTEVQPTTVESFEKKGYSRLDVRKVRGR